MKITKTEQPCNSYSISQRFLEKSYALQKVLFKTTILIIIASCISCGIGMYLTTKEIYWQQIFIVPFHFILILIIIRLNNNWCNKAKNSRT